MNLKNLRNRGKGKGKEVPKCRLSKCVAFGMKATHHLLHVVGRDVDGVEQFNEYVLMGLFIPSLGDSWRHVGPRLWKCMTLVIDER